jgi:glycosyltransferase involved in cell wall biosynthesis
MEGISTAGRAESKAARRFSVVIPTRNRLGSLKKALETVFAQDYPPDRFEVIVVNDGSVDGTWEYLQRVQAERPAWTVTLVDLGKNHGIPFARNAGVRASSGEIIAFIDDDCIASANWLKALDDAYLRHPQTVAAGVRLENMHPQSLIARYVHCNHIYAMNTLHLPESARLSDIRKNFRQPDGDCAVKGCGAGHNSYRRRVFDEAGLFDEGIPYAEDVEFNIRLSGHYGANQIRYTGAAAISHDYNTSLLPFLRQFCRYGLGGRSFRRIRDGHSREKNPGFWFHRLYTANFMVAASLEAKKNTGELAPLLALSALAHICLLAGEAYQTLKEDDDSPGPHQPPVLPR